MSMAATEIKILELRSALYLPLGLMKLRMTELVKLLSTWPPAICMSAAVLASDIILKVVGGEASM